MPAFVQSCGLRALRRLLPSGHFCSAAQGALRAELDRARQRDPELYVRRRQDLEVPAGPGRCHGGGSESEEADLEKLATGSACCLLQANRDPPPASMRHTRDQGSLVDLGIRRERLVADRRRLAAGCRWGLGRLAACSPSGESAPLRREATELLATAASAHIGPEAQRAEAADQASEAAYVRTLTRDREWRVMRWIAEVPGRRVVEAVLRRGVCTEADVKLLQLELSRAEEREAPYPFPAWGFRFP